MKRIVSILLSISIVFSIYLLPVRAKETSSANDTIRVSEPMVFSNATYRILTIPLDVTDSYIPYIEIYVKTSESRSDWGIQDICSSLLITNYNGYKGLSKEFVGEFYTWLRSPYEIEFVVNGDFVNDERTIATFSSDYCYDHRTVAFQF